VTDWISNIVMAPGADGDRGGKWTLTITRINEDEHWCALDIDERASKPGMKVFLSDRDGLPALIVVDSALNFQDACNDLGLDPAVFGSPTLWPQMHRRNHSGVEPTGESGWSWVNEGVLEGFPFSD
jgi:hypothetical protein